MRTSVVCSLAYPLAVAATAALARTADADTWYVSPTGTATSGCTTRSTPCDLTSAATGAVAGDTVILMDGTYNTQLNVANSGTPSAWITFQADTCATPIIQGPGVSPTSTNQDTGVGSFNVPIPDAGADAGMTGGQGTYLRFVGLVSQGWSTGFGNGWTGTATTNSNGHFEYDDCVADRNGRTGITFFSAEGITVKNCIVAHNGSSTAESWSSGVTLYEAQGGAGDSLIEGNVSFKNMDAQKQTDGSGFIIDEYSDGATFVDNIGFRNAGSCLRLTLSQKCQFINNTCYHNAQDTGDMGPSNPGEVYFTQDSNNSTTTGVTFMNNVFVATGTGPGAMAIFNQPASGWSDNQVTTGSVSFFTAPDGTNPDFTLASGSALVGKGGTGSGVPANDIGFDPKCIVKGTPTPIGMMATGSFWQYSVDLTYIQSIGGVANCFHAKTRSGTPDIGAYANGAVTKSTPGSCTPPASGGSADGGGASGGTTGSGGGGTTSSGGGGTTSGGGAGSGGGGGATGNGGGGAGSGGGGTSTVSGESANGDNSGGGSSSKGCSVGTGKASPSWLLGGATLGLGALVRRRRRRA